MNSQAEMEKFLLKYADLYANGWDYPDDPSFIKEIRKSSRFSDK